MALFSVEDPIASEKQRDKSPCNDYYQSSPSKERLSVVTIIVWTVAITLLAEFGALVGMLYLMEYMQ